MIKAVCAEKAQKLLFSRLEPDRSIIPVLCVSSADSGNVPGLGMCLCASGRGGKLEVGAPGEESTDPNRLVAALQLSSSPAQPSPATRLMPSTCLPRACHRESPQTDGSARTSVSLPTSPLPPLSPLRRAIFKDMRREEGCGVRDCPVVR